MKYTSKLFLAIILIVAFAACKKVADLPYYTNGKAPALTASTTSVAAAPTDSLNAALTLSWTYPDFATDSAHTKFVVQIDSVGGDFSRAVTRTVLKSQSITFTAKELNDILLSYGYAFGVSYNIPVRVIASYGNNNDQLISNVLTIQITPYKVPPKVMPPASGHLYLVGDATGSGWNNPVAASSQEFTMIDSLTYVDTLYLNSGGQYVFLPVNGDWTHKYNVADASVAGLAMGGNFGLDLGNANIPGPATTGLYSIKVDFQHGTFSVTPVKQYGVLYVPGDYQGWTPATAHKLGSPANDGNYEGYVDIPAGGSYQFKFTTGPDWSNAIGDGGNGTLVPGGGGNLMLPGPGYYQIKANTGSNTWSATATTWSIIGGFAASNWGNDIPMTYNSSENRWIGSITTAAGDQFKFRANNSWNLNYGDNGKGMLVEGGANIGDPAHSAPLTAGPHTVILYLNNAGYYTYSIQ